MSLTAPSLFSDGAYPDSGRFDESWRKSCRVLPCSIADVDEFIWSHYLGKRPAIVLLCLMMVHDINPVGCIVFSAPPKETERRYGGATWELARLYLRDRIPKNAETWLIAQGVKHIRRHHSEVQYLVSYADPGAGHRGTIYRAANWIADGRTDEERKTPRSDYYDAATGQKYGRRANMPKCAIIERRPRPSKLRFYYPMKRRGGQP